MTSIYRQALGTDFDRLHPRIRERFGFGSEDGVASVGFGVMDRIWYSKMAALPLHIGTYRRILFPQGGVRVPFSIDNYAYKDGFGRESVTWCRSFRFPDAVRRFDATMIYSRKRGKIVDYLGTKQHLAVDLDVSVAENGGIRIRSGDQRFYEGRLAFRFPAPFTGVADVCEWYDDRQETFKISVQVVNPLIGTVFRYYGRFQAQLREVGPGGIPADVLPMREEIRE
ncbi:hypothetical protein J19TS2_54390 [Cohnella xylanilytica]|uniref:DUF4166 domain-containing protein n=1 Tax=Cohnella TaxID=329857 RepID=UPI001967559C|nr:MULTISPECIES: DUF4166 domain-containing protein [Cohnella]MBN2980187.1 DUF4166 domain-containing protein [Cohnella algarum]GIO15884.1 hypothetical protein J19TS2_54390 [Cohnella xylanilytica]